MSHESCLLGSCFCFLFQVIAAALWFFCICLAILVVYCTYSKYVVDIRPWSSAEQSAYEALSRPVWALCVAWVVYACSNELAGRIPFTITYLGRVKRKSAWELAQTVRIYMILRMRNVSSGIFLFIETFCCIQWLCFWDSEGICAVWSGPSLSNVPKTSFRMVLPILSHVHIKFLYSVGWSIGWKITICLFVFLSRFKLSIAKSYFPWKIKKHAVPLLSVRGQSERLNRWDNFDNHG